MTDREVRKKVRQFRKKSGIAHKPSSAELKRAVERNGETLAGICQKYGVDYRENEAEILSLNSISDPNLIYVGQQIKIPVKD